MDEWKWWDELDGEDQERNAWGWPHYDVDAVARFIEDQAFIAGAVLDLGCGPGRLGHALARRNPWVKFTGIDVSMNMVSRATRTGTPDNWHAVTNDGRSLPDEKYNTIYSVTVFQHLPHDVVAQYVSQAYDRLVDDGTLIFTYAVGDEVFERSYQVSTDIALEWCHMFGSVQTLATPATHPDWNWMVARK